MLTFIMDSEDHSDERIKSFLVAHATGERSADAELLEGIQEHGCVQLLVSSRPSYSHFIRCAMRIRISPRPS
ncbi:MAG: hypothetical protein CSA97_02810 [Bacteroidetes bacterium]|nr:MAG: hypothetical protein CSA97_02810 [Bacteroidota bacterium]